MISSLSNFDNVTAAGILARAALSLEDSGNPAAENQFPDESSIRESIFKDVRINLGLSADDMSEEAIEKVGEALDEESDRLLGESNYQETLTRLSEKGELPSDLYEINIDPNIKNFFGKKYDFEKKLIEDTVKFPDQEQHYGKPKNSDEPYLISLFTKFFPNKFPNNSFTMLVAAERRGLALTVHQAWRIYKSKVNLEGVTDLVDMLRRFADKFGAEIKFRDQKSHFFLTADMPKNSPLEFKFEMASKENEGKKRHDIVITYFLQENPENPENPEQRAALIVAIDRIKYRNLLKSHGW